MQNQTMLLICHSGLVVIGRENRLPESKQPQTGSPWSPSSSVGLLYCLRERRNFAPKQNGRRVCSEVKEQCLQSLDWKHSDNAAGYQKLTAYFNLVLNRQFNQRWRKRVMKNSLWCLRSAEQQKTRPVSCLGQSGDIQRPPRPQKSFNWPACMQGMSYKDVKTGPSNKTPENGCFL